MKGLAFDLFNKRNRFECFAVDVAGAVLHQHVVVVLGTVAFVMFESVRWVAFIEPIHYFVSGNLSDNRGGGNGTNFVITIDYRGGWDGGVFKKVTIDQQVLRGELQIVSRPLEC